MEILSIVLASLITLLSPIGWVSEKIVAQQIRARIDHAESIAVRIDNVPTYQIVNGKVNQIRIAGRGVFPVADLRIEALEVETDPIVLDPIKLRKLKVKLAQPVRAGVKLVMTERDLNQALASPAVVKRLRALAGRITSQAARYEFLHPQVNFLPNQRVKFSVDLQEQGQTETLNLVITTGITIKDGRFIQLTDTDIVANKQPVYPPLAKRLVAGINAELDLDRLAKSGINARILSLDLSEQKATLATFVYTQ
jgi:LmeA-like phospholipid-binding